MDLAATSWWKGKEENTKMEERGKGKLQKGRREGLVPKSGFGLPLKICCPRASLADYLPLYIFFGSIAFRFWSFSKPISLLFTPE